MIAAAGDNHQVLTQIARDLQPLNHRLTIIAPDGVVTADSQRNAQLMENHADRPEIIIALAEGTGSQQSFFVDNSRIS